MLVPVFSGLHAQGALDKGIVERSANVFSVVLSVYVAAGILSIGIPTLFPPCREYAIPLRRAARRCVKRMLKAYHVSPHASIPAFWRFPQFTNSQQKAPRGRVSVRGLCRFCKVI